jgi:hypothetical protein
VFGTEIANSSKTQVRSSRLKRNGKSGNVTEVMDRGNGDALRAMTDSLPI